MADLLEACCSAPARRRFLRDALLGLPAAISVCGPAFAMDDSRRVTLLSTHTGERLSAAYFSDGDYRDNELAALDQLVRDHRTGEVHGMDRRLFDLMHELAVAAALEPLFEVISGYRSPRTNEMLADRSGGVSRQSLHLEGRAIDIRLVGCPTARLRDLAISLAAGGVGYYPSSDFIHIDTGRVRIWSG